MELLALKAQELVNLRFISIKKMLDALSLWRQRSVMRQQLGKLPDYRLDDMGISAEQAFAESQKPFWEE